MSHLKDRLVLRTGTDFDDRGDVVADCAERCDATEVAALVGEESHQLLSTVAGVFTDEDDLFVSDGVGRVTQRRLDVLAHEMWIGVEEISLGGTFAQFAKNQLDRNPRSPDRRLSEHHAGIHFDAISEGHALPVSRIHLTIDLEPGRS